MGGANSQITPSAIANPNARSFFELFVSIQNQVVPENVQKSKQYKILCKILFDSLKRTLECDYKFGAVISGIGSGPIFMTYFITRVDIPLSLTKISLRKCSLNSSDVKEITLLLSKAKHLEQIDLSDNDFGAEIVQIIDTVIANRALNSLILENCNSPDTVFDSVKTIIENTRNITTLRLSPINLEKAHQDTLLKSLHYNNYLQTISLAENTRSHCGRVMDKNTLVNEIVDTIARAPFQRLFRAKIESFKSVKGREMVTKRAKQKELMKGTNIYIGLSEAEERSKHNEIAQSATKNEIVRCGHADMAGRRPNMEDVSLQMSDFPDKNSMLVGVFDGHGGREAAEYASSELPKLLLNLFKKQVKEQKDNMNNLSALNDAFNTSFIQIQNDMKPWCLYVGTTVCLAVIDKSSITVANVGDTRCVLSRNGKAIRLSVDHKPEIPSENEYIQAKGGFVREGRLGGMLAVSRALGDGFLGEAVNPTPSVSRTEITDEDSYLIIACDGVWDVMSDQEACDYIASEIDPLQAALKLRDHAFELNSLDNISVIVVFLSDIITTNDEK